MSDKDFRPFECRTCGFVYDPVEGDSARGIGPGVAFSDLPKDWRCPSCGSNRKQFGALPPRTRPAEPGPDYDEEI